MAQKYLVQAKMYAKQPDNVKELLNQCLNIDIVKN
jgi:hypothetical protein